MAHRAMHARNDSGVSVNSIIVHENPPSPTLTNPEMIMPIPPWEVEPSFDEGPHPLLDPEPELGQIRSDESLSDHRNSGASSGDIGVATALLMPMRLTVPPPTSIHGAATPIPTYTGYEHGAPLSDIYEESEATATPKSLRHRSPSPESPTPLIHRESSTTPTNARQSLQSLRHKKRNSSLSTSSSGGSDVGDWENFDSSKVLTSRVAADLAQMRREETLDVDDGLAASRRASREEEELAALNARAEKILENARKRLTHMSDNLKTARSSIIIPNRSPNLGGEHQPVGGLYRSISAAGATKLAKNRQNILPIRTTASLQHMRGASDLGVTSSSSNRLSRLPDTRSASALEYGSATRYSLFPENTPPTSRVQASPISTKSHNSPLRPLEEEQDSPSTAQTTPESVKDQGVKGLGIHSAVAVSPDNIVMADERSASRQTSTPTPLMRSGSAASIRSTKELKDQMSEMRSRIADLRSKAHADHLKRQSISSIRSSSPFTNAQPDQWYSSSPAYQENSSPISARGGIGSRDMSSPTLPGPVARLRQLEARNDLPHTPTKDSFLAVDRGTPETEIRLLSSAKTDRNAPLGTQDDGSRAARKSSIGEDESEETNDADEHDERSSEAERIAENEEEQIYLNEVLEESLREAEIEEDVPPIPEEYLNNSTSNSEPQRHEDRVDAFDYENMFLHSAMGNYAGHDLGESDSGSGIDSDEDGSVETSRMDARTPVDDLDDSSDKALSESDAITDGEPDNTINLSKNVTTRAGPYSQQKQLRSPPPIHPPEPSKSWVHARTKSADSVSTSASFETATEGQGDSEDEPSEIFTWNPAPSSSVGYSPNSHQTYRSTQNSPARTRHGFSSPQGGGRVTPQASRSAYASPLHKPASPLGLGLGLGVIGGENSQYINDNGIPERFQGQASPVHSRQSSIATLQKIRPESQATIVPSPKKHERQISGVRMPLTPKSVASGSPVLVTVTNSPQRKVVINRTLQRPEGFAASRSEPPNMPLPAPPSSAALQAQMVSPRRKKERVDPVPNTEVLMESLIKLADPEFMLAPGMMFEEVDKNLVLGLLGAVGGVCNDILHAGVQSGSPALGKTQADATVDDLRGRLQRAAEILAGIETRSGMRVKEI